MRQKHPAVPDEHSRECGAHVGVSFLASKVDLIIGGKGCLPEKRQNVLFQDQFSSDFGEYDGAEHPIHQYLQSDPAGNFAASVTAHAVGYGVQPEHRTGSRFVGGRKGQGEHAVFIQFADLTWIGALTHEQLQAQWRGHRFGLWRRLGLGLGD